MSSDFLRKLERRGNAPELALAEEVDAEDTEKGALVSVAHTEPNFQLTRFQLTVVAEQLEFRHQDLGAVAIQSIPAPQYPQELAAADNRRASKGMRTGAKWNKTPVRIVRGAEKGRVGTVVDYHEKVRKGGATSLVFTVRGEDTNATWQVKEDELIHRW